MIGLVPPHQKLVVLGIEKVAENGLHKLQHEHPGFVNASNNGRGANSFREIGVDQLADSVTDGPLRTGPR